MLYKGPLFTRPGTRSAPGSTARPSNPIAIISALFAAPAPFAGKLGTRMTIAHGFALEREVKISLAGALAVRRAFPSSRWRSGADDDYYKVGDILSRVYASLRKGDEGWLAQGHFLRLMELETGWLLAQRWHCVKAVAEQLLARTTMSGSQIKETIFRAWDEGPAPVESTNRKWYRSTQQLDRPGRYPGSGQRRRWNAGAPWPQTHLKDR
jgi:hypothetical protein